MKPFTRVRAWILALEALAIGSCVYSAHEAREAADRAERRVEIALAVARGSEEHAAGLLLREDEKVQEIGERLDDVERLVIELQDGVPAGAYREGFPEPGSR